MLGNITKLLDKHGLTYHAPEDGQGNVQLNCPFCEETNQRFGVHINSEKWNCFNCGIKSLTLPSLDKKLTQLANGELDQRKTLPKEETESNYVVINPKIVPNGFKKLKLKGRRTLGYLRKDRGFTIPAIKHFKLGTRVFKDKRGNAHEYLIVPYIENKEVVNIKYRTTEPQPTEPDEKKMWKKFKWRREKGGKSVLFNGDCITDDTEEVFLLEAELDAISLWSQGIQNVVSTTVGAGATGTSGFKQEWYEKLLVAKKIYILYDNDEKGQEGALGIAKRLGLKRCYNIVLPKDVKDVNEFFWNTKTKEPNYSMEDFKHLKENAQQFKIPDIISSRESLRTVLKRVVNGDEGELRGMPSPWKNVNKIIGGVKPGELIVVAARPKVGKTTATFQWISEIAEHGDPTFYICCEMKHDELSSKLIAMKRKDFTNVAELTEHQVLSVMTSFPTENLHYWYPFEDDLNDIDKIREKIREAVQRYGCKYVVFDNLQFLTRSKSGNSSDLGGIASRMFKTLAVELDIVIFLVVQPRKTNNNRPLSVDDLKDTSSTFQDLNTLILMHRPYIEGDKLSDDEEDNKAMSDLCQIDVVMRSGPGGRAWLWFNGPRSLFKAEGPSFDKEIKAEMDKIKTRMKAKDKRETTRR